MVVCVLGKSGYKDSISYLDQHSAKESLPAQISDKKSER